MIYRFGQFTLDTENYELSKDSRALSVEPQVFSLLAFLIENRDRVVSKDGLIEAVWQGRIVSDANLTTRINAARKAVGDDGATQAVIKTFPRRGFRFMAEVEEGAPRSSAAIDLSAPVAGFEGRPAIAVLPFENLSADPEQEFFVDGLVDDITLRLSLWRWFPVIARNSAFAFKGQAVDIKDVGQQLGARYIVEGAVRKLGNRLRISAELVDATNGHRVWSERYDREIEDLFALQDEITDHIVGALVPAIGEIEQNRIRLRNPESLDAWEACQRGFWHSYQDNRQDNLAAMEWFKKSIGLDPNSALAYGGLSANYIITLLAGWAEDIEQTCEEMRQAGQQAVRLNSRSARGNMGVGFAQIFSRHHGSGLASLEKAVECNPSLAHAHHFLGFAQMLSGHERDAIESAKKAMRISPRDPLIARMFCVLTACHTYLGEYVKAVEYGDLAVAHAPNFPMTHRVHATALAYAGRIEEAKPHIEILLRLLPGYSIDEVRRTTPHEDPAKLDILLDGLRKAGLPEE